MHDPHNLQRFLDAQDPVYAQVCDELRAGYKRNHWMWFIFPQIKGLGYSQMAIQYAITSRDEAVAYLAHPILGERLQECARLVNAIEGRSATQIFGSPDDMKFKSSMTLFASAAGGDSEFSQAIEKYFAGQPDLTTLRSLYRTAL